MKFTDQVARAAARIPLGRWRAGEWQVTSTVIRRLIHGLGLLGARGPRGADGLQRFLRLLVGQNSLVRNHGHDGSSSRARPTLRLLEAAPGCAVVAILVLHRDQLAAFRVPRNCTNSARRFRLVLAAPSLRRLVLDQRVRLLDRPFHFLVIHRRLKRFPVNQIFHSADPLFSSTKSSRIKYIPTITRRRFSPERREKFQLSILQGKEIKIKTTEKFKKQFKNLG